MAASAQQPADRGKSFAGRTDVGCVREHNEDSIVVSPPLYVVCDGMGGHAAGEVASEIAVQVIRNRAPHTADADALGQAVEEANLAIMKAAHEGRGREGMGTTCTAAMVEGDRLVIAQVGDSRAYLLSKGHLQQLTRDHSLMADLIEAGRITPEEARVHPKRSIITRALGSDARTRPDLFEITVADGDRLLLCSDGLTTMLTDDEISDILMRHTDPDRCAQALVDSANAAGGFDNISVIVVDISGESDAKVHHVARRTKRTAIALVAIMLVIFIGAGALFAYFANTSAYLTVQDGRVAVYSGLQGNVFGFSMSELVRVTDVQADQLPPGVATRLETDGIRVDSLEAAEHLVAQYEQEAAQYRETNGISETDGTGDDAGSDAEGTGGDAGDAGSAGGNGGDASNDANKANASTTQPANGADAS